MALQCSIVNAATFGVPRGGPRSAMNASLVGCTALQDRRATIPVPRNAEASECFTQNRRLQRRLRPALATVGRDLDFADAAIPGKGNARDLVEAGPLHVQSRRRVS